MKLKNRKKLYDSDFENENINPLDGLSNIADVMLVLAVGIMLALIVAYELPINSDESAGSDGKLEQADIIGDITEGDENDFEGELSEYGRVYIDEGGNYYIVGEGK